jgi:hypothetical protein
VVVWTSDNDTRSRDVILILAMVIGAQRCSNYSELLCRLKNDKSTNEYGRNLTPRGARDAARCLLTEETSGMEVITVDQLGADGPDVFEVRLNKHISCNVNTLHDDSSRGARSRVEQIVEGRLQEVYLDYCWSVGSYWSSHLNDPFFTKTLPWLGSLLKEGGYIYLPLHPTIFVHMIKAMESLAPYLSLGLLNMKEVKSLSLVKATDKIDPDDWCDLFAKDQKQQQSLVITECFLQSLMDSCNTTDGPELKKMVSSIFKSLTTGQECFISLKRLPNIQCDPTRKIYIDRSTK